MRPEASTIVALLIKSCVMKSQMGSGWLHTTLKYFERLKLSIKLSIIKERIDNPSKEYRPVLMSKIKKPAMVNAKSVKSNARPMLMLVYFLKNRSNDICTTTGRTNVKKYSRAECGKCDCKGKFQHRLICQRMGHRKNTLQ